MTKHSVVVVLGLWACTGAEPEVVPVEKPAESELVGTWGLTVDAHRITGKAYGRPANGFELVLEADHAARWADVPAVVWRPGAEVLERVEGQGTWSLVEHDGSWGVRIEDGGGQRVARVAQTGAVRLLVLDEQGVAEGEKVRSLELTRADVEGL